MSVRANSQVDTFVSLVTIAGPHHTSLLYQVVEQAIDLLQDQYTNFELIIVDNGLASGELSALQSLLEQLPCIRILRLSRHSDFDTAVFCGLEAAIGDYVVVFEAGSDPVEEIPNLIVEMLRGADIVQGLSSSRDRGARRRIARAWFFWLSRVAAGLNVSANATYFSSFSRRAVNAMAGSPTGLKYLRHLLRHIGFEVIEFDYERMPEEIGRNRPGVVDAIEVITNYSLRPLRAIATLGLIAAVVNLIYAVYVVFAFLSSTVERGWTTTNFQLAVMFFVLFTAVAVISEYLGRILSESRRGPSYVVMEELVSTQLIADENRRNIA